MGPKGLGGVNGNLSTVRNNEHKRKNTEPAVNKMSVSGMIIFFLCDKNKNDIILNILIL